MIIKNFKNSRENIDIKQKDIAEFFNLNFTTISGWETGKDTIPLRRLIEYANHYNFSLDYLFGITNKNDESYLPLEIDIDLISKNLRILRKRNSMTQEEVAKKMNIAPDKIDTFLNAYTKTTYYIYYCLIVTLLN